MKHPVLIVLKALLAGIRVRGEDGITYCVSDEGQFGFQLKGMENSDQMHVADWPLNWFLKFSQNLSEEELISIAANLALQEKD